MTTREILIEELIGIALQEVGTKEEGGNNLGPQIVEYQKATWIEPGPWAWCAAFACWILKKWLKNPLVRSELKLASEEDAENWRCKYPSAFGWEEWAEKKEISIFSEHDLAKKGDFMVFDMSHIGLVIRDQVSFITGENLVHTIEGNTNGKGKRDSKGTDGVWIKDRLYTMTKSYIRILQGA